MTVEHVLFIPSVLLVGLAVGYMLGMRAAKDEYERKAAARKK